MKKPNILIILAEDISTDIACYNDENALTTCLDLRLWGCKFVLQHGYWQREMVLE